MTTPLVYGGILQASTTSMSIGAPAKLEYVKAEQVGMYFSDLSKLIIDAISCNHPLAQTMVEIPGQHKEVVKARCQSVWCVEESTSSVTAQSLKNISKPENVDATGKVKWS